MTSQGLDAAIDTWLAAYAKYFQGNASPKKDCCGNHEDCEGGHEDGEQACEGNCEHHKEVEE
jgi:hypothetical protein